MLADTLCNYTTCWCFMVTGSGANVDVKHLPRVWCAWQCWHIWMETRNLLLCDKAVTSLYRLGQSTNLINYRLWSKKNGSHLFPFILVDFSCIGQCSIPTLLSCVLHGISYARFPTKFVYFISQGSVVYTPLFPPMYVQSKRFLPLSSSPPDY